MAIAARGRSPSPLASGGKQGNVRVLGESCSIGRANCVLGLPEIGSPRDDDPAGSYVYGWPAMKGQHDHSGASGDGQLGPVRRGAHAVDRALRALGTGRSDRRSVLSFHGSPNGRPHCAELVPSTTRSLFHQRPRIDASRATSPRIQRAVWRCGSSIDLILEGDAERAVDPRRWRQSRRFPPRRLAGRMDGDAITPLQRAQSAGPPPWLYRVNVATAFGVGLRELHGASRWRFQPVPVAACFIPLRESRCASPHPRDARSGQDTAVRASARRATASPWRCERRAPSMDGARRQKGAT